MSIAWVSEIGQHTDSVLYDQAKFLNKDEGGQKHLQSKV